MISSVPITSTSSFLGGIMTAISELFVTEDVKFEVEKILKENNFYIDVPSEWLDIWSISEFPDYGEAEIRDLDTDEVLGLVRWKTKFFIEKDIFGRFINAEPEITYLEYKGKVYIK